MAGSRSGIIQSPKKFCIDESMLSSSMYSGAIDVATLEEISDLAVNQHINVQAKVKSVKPAEKDTVASCGRTLLKEDVVLPDPTGICRCVLWEKDVEKLVVDHCY